MSKKTSESFERASRNFQIEQQCKGLREGTLVLIEGTDTIVTRDEFHELVSDLTAQGQQLAPSQSAQGSSPLYLDDKRIVFVTSALKI